ncbi:hypothetical protein ACFFQF_21055 [Haladaptatus pallidirubidus]|uniref:Uncharacterized protein n=1 Tax=Haladaptatus pallidirubidus TaxID=1008152 RepID=A0AAV3UGG2_9EURY|nr:hypothetical protein [Haladaptatus pallidirubidus]
MSAPTPDTDECPLCGKSYDQQLVIGQGLRWEDLFPGTVFDFFTRYPRRCTARYDVEADTHLPEQKRAIYFHTGQSDSPFARQ